jgi:arginine decarboxylase
MILPKKVFLTKGVGRHRDKLSSFEAALRDAGIERFNIVRVSSILPPGCKFLSRHKGVQYLTPGEVIFCVMSENSTDEPHRLISASVGVAVPKESNQYGYLSEYHSFGETEAKAGDYAEDLAATMLATTLGVEFEPTASWDDRKEIWKISGKIVRTMNITQTAIGDKRGWWTTVIAVAVLLS